MAKYVTNDNVGAFLMRLYNDEVPYRLETNHMIGYAISLTKFVNGYSPRVLIDNNSSGLWKEIIAETDEHREKRQYQELPPIDWEIRIFEETLPATVEKICEYMLYEQPEHPFSKWYKEFKDGLSADIIQPEEDLLYNVHYQRSIEGSLVHYTGNIYQRIQVERYETSRYYNFKFSFSRLSTSWDDITDFKFSDHLDLIQDDLSQKVFSFIKEEEATEKSDLQEPL